MRWLTAAIATCAVAASFWLPSCTSFGAADAPGSDGGEASAASDAEAGAKQPFCATKPTAQVCVDFEDSVIRSKAWSDVDQENPALYMWAIGSNPMGTNHYLQIPLPPPGTMTQWKNGLIKALPTTFPATVRYGLALKAPELSPKSYVEFANLQSAGSADAGANSDINVSLRWDGGQLIVSSTEKTVAVLGALAPGLERFDFEVSLGADPWLVVRRGGVAITLTGVHVAPTTTRAVKFVAGLPYATRTNGEAFSVDDIYIEWQ